MYNRLTGNVWAGGLIFFAGIVMIVAGICGAVQGLAALLEDSFYVVAPNYLFEVDVTAWGWVHLFLGAAVAAIGACLLAGQGWARWAAIVVTVLSAIANFLSIPYYPIWAITLIALDIAIIWAIAAHGRELAS